MEKLKERDDFVAMFEEHKDTMTSIKEEYNNISEIKDDDEDESGEYMDAIEEVKSQLTSLIDDMQDVVLSMQESELNENIDDDIYNSINELSSPEGETKSEILVDIMKISNVIDNTITSLNEISL